MRENWADLMFCVEVEMADDIGELEMWVDELGLGPGTPMLEVVGEMGPGHERNMSKDSAVGLVEDDGDSVESGIGFGSLDRVMADTKSLAEEREEMMDFASWIDAAEMDFPVPCKSPKRGKELLAPPRSPRRGKRISIPYKSPQRRKEPPPKSSRRQVLCGLTPTSPTKASPPRPRKERGKETPPPQFRDSGLDVSSPVRSVRKKPSARWI